VKTKRKAKADAGIKAAMSKNCSYLPGPWRAGQPAKKKEGAGAHQSYENRPFG